jgi:hypothetical protein
MSPPPIGFAAPEIGEGGSDVAVAEFVYKSGRRQRWALPAGADDSSDRAAGMAKVSQAAAIAPEK